MRRLCGMNCGLGPLFVDLVLVAIEVPEDWSLWRVESVAEARSFAVVVIRHLCGGLSFELYISAGIFWCSRSSPPLSSLRQLYLTEETSVFLRVGEQGILGERLKVLVFYLLDFDDLELFLTSNAPMVKRQNPAE